MPGAPTRLAVLAAEVVAAGQGVRSAESRPPLLIG
ncbi:hypothetical protein VTH82DRAFT_7196 [Thermothelomyces myriococcoides]